MSKHPAIVAELGRPETPDEAAARKSAARAKRRANQTMTNLVLSLLASLAVVVAIVLVVLRPDPPAREPVDVPAVAATAQRSIDTPLVVPALSPEWRANDAGLRTGAADIVSWYAGYVTPGEAFVSITQGVGADATWLATTLREAEPTGSLTIDGVAWQEYDQRGDDVGNLEYALSTEADGAIVVLAGTADDTEFLQFAEAVSAELAR